MAPLLFGLSAVVVLVIMALPSQTLSWMRSEYLLVGMPLNWIESHTTGIDFDHVVMFALLGFFWKLLSPATRGWRIALMLLALGVATELMQYVAPGRTPRQLDVRDDMAGGLAGLFLATMLNWLGSHHAALLSMSRWLLLAGVAVLPLQQWQVSAFGGYGVLPSDALFALAIGLRTIAWASGRAPLRMAGFSAWLLAYVLVMAASCLVSANVIGSAGKWLGVAYLAALAALVCDLAGEAGFVRKLAWAWIGAAVVTSLLSLIAILGFYLAPGHAALQPLLSHYGSLPPGPYPRVHSTFTNANMLCNYLTVAVCLLLAAHKLDWVGQRVFTILLTCLLLSGLATISPGIGGIALVLGVWGWWSLREDSPWMARLALAGGALIAALVLASTWLNPAAPFVLPSVRSQIWQQAWHTWLQHPMLGVGLGQDVAGVAFLDPSGNAHWLTDAHNVWLSIAGQAGLLGLISLLGLTLWLLRGSLSLRDGTNDRANVHRACAVALFSALVYQGLTGSFEDARHLWVLVGLLAALKLRAPVATPVAMIGAPAARH